MQGQIKVQVHGYTTNAVYSVIVDYRAGGEHQGGAVRCCCSCGCCQKRKWCKHASFVLLCISDLSAAEGEEVEFKERDLNLEEEEGVAQLQRFLETQESAGGQGVLEDDGSIMGEGNLEGREGLRGGPENEDNIDGVELNEETEKECLGSNLLFTPPPPEYQGKEKVQDEKFKVSAHFKNSRVEGLEGAEQEPSFVQEKVISEIEIETKIFRGLESVFPSKEPLKNSLNFLLRPDSGGSEKTLVQDSPPSLEGEGVEVEGQEEEEDGKRLEMEEGNVLTRGAVEAGDPLQTQSFAGGKENFRLFLSPLPTPPQENVFEKLFYSFPEKGEGGVESEGAERGGGSALRKRRISDTPMLQFEEDNPTRFFNFEKKKEREDSQPMHNTLVSCEKKVFDDPFEIDKVRTPKKPLPAPSVSVNSLAFSFGDCFQEGWQDLERRGAFGEKGGVEEGRGGRGMGERRVDHDDGGSVVDLDKEESPQHKSLFFQRTKLKSFRKNSKTEANPNRAALARSSEVGNITSVEGAEWSRRCSSEFPCSPESIDMMTNTQRQASPSEDVAQERGKRLSRISKSTKIWRFTPPRNRSSAGGNDGVKGWGQRGRIRFSVLSRASGVIKKC